MIRSVPNQTNHILTALNNYVVDIEDPNYLKYTFAYLELDEILLNKIILNLKDASFKRDERRYFRIPQPLTLIKSTYINDYTHDEVTGFEYVKLDSISYLEGRPSLNDEITQQIHGGISCFNDYFTIDIEKIPKGLMMPTLIYKSPRYVYSKLLNQ